MDLDPLAASSSTDAVYLTAKGLRMMEFTPRCFLKSPLGKLFDLVSDSLGTGPTGDIGVSMVEPTPELVERFKFDPAKLRALRGTLDR